MDVVTKILENLQTAIDASPLEASFKLILGAFVLIIGIWAYFNKKRLRKHASETNQNRDREADIGDNVGTETQNSQDGQSVRDQVRRGNQ